VAACAAVLALRYARPGSAPIPQISRLAHAWANRPAADNIPELNLLTGTLRINPNNIVGALWGWFAGGSATTIAPMEPTMAAATQMHNPTIDQFFMRAPFLIAGRSVTGGGNVNRIRVAVFYPFIPVSVIPCTKYRCVRKNTRITGTVISKLAAMVSTGLELTCTLNAYRPNARG